MEDGVADVDEVGAEGQVGAVFFDDAEGQDADALRFFESLDEIGRGEFFPLGGECVGGLECDGEREKGGDSHGVNCTSPGLLYSVQTL